MPNTNAPTGLKPTRHQAGGVIRTTAYPGGIASGLAASIYYGDPVILLASGRLQVAAAGSANLLGVFAGVEYTDSLGRRQYSKNWPAATVATNIIAYVYDDPNLLYQVQFDSNFTLTMIGTNTDILYASGTSTTGISRVQASSTVEASGTTAQLRIYGLVQDPDNEYGTNAKVEVLLNESLFRSQTGI
jgi:hypothetical protein